MAEALVGLAARLAGCPLDAVLMCRRREDRALVVVVWPGAKYVYAAEVVAAEEAIDEVEVREVLRGPLSESAPAAGVVVARRPRKPRTVRS